MKLSRRNYIVKVNYLNNLTINNDIEDEFSSAKKL